MYVELVEKIIAVLKAHPELASPGRVRRYHFGAPRVEPVEYPYIYVQWSRQEPADPATTRGFLYNLAFEIGVADRSAREDEAERRVYRLVEAVQEALKANPTLDGLVENHPAPVEVGPIERFRVGDRYAVTSVPLTYVRRVWRDAF
jgi:hypothetical protein